MPSDRDINPFSLSRRLEECHKRLQAFKEKLVDSPSYLDPFLGDTFPGKSTFEWALKLGESDPLREALLGWIHRLTDARIHVPWTVKDAELERRTLYPQVEPESAERTVAETRLSALSSRGDLGAAYYRALGSMESQLSAHRQELWGRRVEVAKRLGLSKEDVLRVPLLKEETDKLKALAQQLLRETSDMAREEAGPGFQGYVEDALALPATEGWPARLAPDTLRELFYERELFKSVDLRPGRLPARLSPASFPRAAAIVGRALAHALMPRDVPYVVARDPDDLMGHDISALFLLWSTSRPFLLRGLALSPHQADEHARLLNRTVIAHARLLAARYLISDAALSGRAPLVEAFAQQSAELFGEPLPETSALVRFRVDVDDGARFVGFLSAFRRRRVALHTYDEDWYRNPRFQEELRATLSVPPLRQRPIKDCEEGLLALLENTRR